MLRGIDTTFEHYERRTRKTKKINGLAWCVQEVLSVAEAMKEAAVGSAEAPGPQTPPGLSAAEIAAFFLRNAEKLRHAAGSEQVKLVAKECASTLTELSEPLKDPGTPVRLEDIERRMTVLEERLMAALMISAPETQLVALRAEADREIAPYRSKMPAAQIEQLTKQFVNKRLLEQAKMPRLSLFYM